MDCLVQTGWRLNGEWSECCSGGRGEFGVENEVAARVIAGWSGGWNEVRVTNQVGNEVEGGVEDEDVMNMKMKMGMRIR